MCVFVRRLRRAYKRIRTGTHDSCLEKMLLNMSALAHQIIFCINKFKTKLQNFINRIHQCIWRPDGLMLFLLTVSLFQVLRWRWRVCERHASERLIWEKVAVFSPIPRFVCLRAFSNSLICPVSFWQKLTGQTIPVRRNESFTFYQNWPARSVKS